MKSSTQNPQKLNGKAKSPSKQKPSVETHLKKRTKKNKKQKQNSTEILTTSIPNKNAPKRNQKISTQKLTLERNPDLQHKKKKIKTK
jgi:hypothetical protein